MPLNFEIYLPLDYNTGKPVEPEKFAITKNELIATFGGFSVIPGEGYIEGWCKVGDMIKKDRIVIFRVQAVGEYDDSFWRSYKEKLKQRFNQQEILIQVSRVDRV